MGFYIEKTTKGERLPTVGKAQALVAAGDATLLPEQPKQFVENLVCVVANGFFDGAGYCYSPEEFARFARPDNRHKVWLIVPEVVALTGYYPD